MTSFDDFHRQKRQSMLFEILVTHTISEYLERKRDEWLNNFGRH